jgi:hypothetical protein
MMMGKKLLGLLAAGASVTLLAPAGAQAASSMVTGTVNGSTLSLSTSASPTFSANLDNGDQTPTYTAALNAEDTRGTGGGWNATVSSTQFSTGAPNNYTLATNASSLTGVAVASGPGTSAAPSNSVAYPVAVPAGSTAPTPVKFFNAASASGLGQFTLTPTIGVFVPQSTYAGSYTSTLTLAIVAGP